GRGRASHRPPGWSRTPSPLRSKCVSRNRLGCAAPCLSRKFPGRPARRSRTATLFPWASSIAFLRLRLSGSSAPLGLHVRQHLLDLVLLFHRRQLLLHVVLEQLRPRLAHRLAVADLVLH